MLHAPPVWYNSEIDRRAFLTLAISSPLLAPLARAQALASTLHNGIQLPGVWPPQLRSAADRPILPPYLAEPPRVIPIDVGRQLFVDDFLIQESTLTRTYHHPTYHPASPVLRPEKPWELRDEYADRTGTPPSPTAMVFSDGVFFDARDKVFKMWYMGGYQTNTCYAISDDGVRWQKPSLDVVRDTNIVLVRARDSSTTWIDDEDVPSRRYKMAQWQQHGLDLFVSRDGIHWDHHGRFEGMDDRTTFFWNPFRRVWVFSIRGNESPTHPSRRYRRYWETPDFAVPSNWSAQAPVAWVKADSADYASPRLADRPELYNLDCVAYESVLLGLFTIWRGESTEREKINELTVGYSRDGFHWYRPDRSSFLGVADTEGSWNWANVQSAGGGCLIVGDQLYFYVSGRQGIPGTNVPGMCSTGLALLRRDGFASMDWLPGETPYARVSRDARVGVLTTRILRFSGSHLFVNADLREGELRVEVLDREGRVIAPFAAANCVAVRGNGTRMAVDWSQGQLAELAGSPVRLRFSLTRGRLYAFWVSRSQTGASGGYTAAGGPEFAGGMDTRERA